MAFVPSAQTVIRDKAVVSWIANGESGDELVLNRPIDDVADMVLTVRADAVVLDPVVSHGGATSQTIEQTVNFNGRVNFLGGSSAGEDAIAMAIALG